MTPLEDFVLAITDALLADAGGDTGPRVEVTDVSLELPVETRIAPGGRLLATLPRNRLATGFDVPAARIALRIARSP